MTDEVKGERKKKTEEEETAAIAAGFLLRPSIDSGLRGTGWRPRETESKDRKDGKTEAGDRGSAAFVRDFGAQGVQVAFGAAPPDKSPRSSMFL